MPHRYTARARTTIPAGALAAHRLRRSTFSARRAAVKYSLPSRIAREWLARNAPFRSRAPATKLSGPELFPLCSEDGTETSVSIRWHVLLFGFLFIELIEMVLLGWLWFWFRIGLASGIVRLNECFVFLQSERKLSRLGFMFRRSAGAMESWNALYASKENSSFFFMNSLTTFIYYSRFFILLLTALLSRTIGLEKRELWMSRNAIIRGFDICSANSLVQELRVKLFWRVEFVKVRIPES